MRLHSSEKCARPRRIAGLRSAWRRTIQVVAERRAQRAVRRAVRTLRKKDLVDLAPIVRVVARLLDALERSQSGSAARPSKYPAHVVRLALALSWVAGLAVVLSRVLEDLLHDARLAVERISDLPLSPALLVIEPQHDTCLLHREWRTRSLLCWAPRHPSVLPERARGV
eukprot:7377147-Prymnesium_polylepis.1